MCDNCKDNKENSIDTSRRGLVKRLFIGLMALPFLGSITKKAEAGIGHCTVYGCPCREFRHVGGLGDLNRLCGNCGHRYYDHY
jgi:hypothetical protein